MARGKVFLGKNNLREGLQKSRRWAKDRECPKKGRQKILGYGQCPLDTLATTLGMYYGPRLWLKYGASKLCE